MAEVVVKVQICPIFEEKGAEMNPKSSPETRGWEPAALDAFRGCSSELCHCSAATAGYFNYVTTSAAATAVHARAGFPDTPGPRTWTRLLSHH